MAIVNGKKIDVNFIEVGEFFPYAEPRAGAPKQIVLHESVGTKDPFNYLKSKKLGVHFVIMGDGKIIQHADPFIRLKHAGKLNDYGIGVEVVNPYTRATGLWDKIINAKWAWKGKYTPPTFKQMESLEKLTRFLTENISTIPFNVVYPFAMGKVQNADNTLSGIWSHQWGWDNHADGSFPALFLQLIEEGNNAKNAYDLAINKATTLTGDTASIQPKTVSDAEQNNLNNSFDVNSLDPVKIIRNIGVGVTVLGLAKVSLDLFKDYLKRKKRR